MKRGTIENTLEVRGLDHYWDTEKGRASMRFEPAEAESGIQLVHPETGEIVVLDHKTVTYESQLGARFLSAQIGETRLKVVEHLISALVAARVNDVIVSLPDGANNNYIPVIGPGIEPIYSQLKAARIDLASDLPEFEVTTTTMLTGEKTALHAHISDTLGFRTSAFLDDVVDFEPSRFEEYDLLGSLENHKDARPLARIQGWKIIPYLWLKSKLNGINPETYVMAMLGDSAEKIISRMDPKYQSGKNEHFAHTSVADFLGELYLHFPGVMKGQFQFSGKANHKNRMALLAELKASGNVSSTNPSRL